jgi:hypothetical protein
VLKTCKAKGKHYKHTYGGEARKKIGESKQKRNKRNIEGAEKVNKRKRKGKSQRVEVRVAKRRNS